MTVARRHPSLRSGQAAGTMLLPLLLLVACSKLLPPKDRVIALEGATLIDGAGGAPKPDMVVIIRNGHVEAIAHVNEIPIPKSAERINLVGKTIIPSLIDAHEIGRAHV